MRMGWQKVKGEKDVWMDSNTGETIRIFSRVAEKKAGYVVVKYDNPMSLHGEIIAKTFRKDVARRKVRGMM